MAADMHIHIFNKELTLADLEAFFSNTIGSRYFNLVNPQDKERTKKKDEAFEKISQSPNIWVGEVSWLKATLTENDEAYIPQVVEKIHALIGEDLPVIDDGMIAKIKDIFQSAVNTTGYKIAKEKGVIQFLEKWSGERVFTVSW